MRMKLSCKGITNEFTEIYDRIDENKWTEDECRILLKAFTLYGKDLDKIKRCLKDKSVKNIKQKLYDLLRHSTSAKSKLLRDPATIALFNKQFLKVSKWTFEEDEQLIQSVFKHGKNYLEL